LTHYSANIYMECETTSN